MPAVLRTRLAVLALAAMFLPLLALPVTAEVEPSDDVVSVELPLEDGGPLDNVDQPSEDDDLISIYPGIVDGETVWFYGSEGCMACRGAEAGAEDAASELASSAADRAVEQALPQADDLLP